MSHENFGKKHFCATCCSRFYDMNQEQAVCPKCKTPVAQLTEEGLLSSAPPKADQNASGLVTKDLEGQALTDDALSVDDLIEDTKDLDDEQDLAVFSKESSQSFTDGP
ncbi:MAG: FYDLN acid domain-containing protein [Holosporaceae bacterium]